MISTLTKKYQATIPKEIRDHLGLKAGDSVKFFLHPDGSAVILPTLPASALYGIFPSSRPPLSDEEMDEAIAEAATSRYREMQQQVKKAG